MMQDPLHHLSVWQINMPRALARRNKMEIELARSGLEYSLFPSVDGKAEADRLLANIDIEAFERNVGCIILIGGLGCDHSHLAVWDTFLATGKPLALILEDDVVFHDGRRVYGGAEARDYHGLP